VCSSDLLARSKRPLGNIFASAAAGGALLSGGGMLVVSVLGNSPALVAAAPGAAALLGGTDAGGRKGEVLSKATDPDGTTAGTGWINVPYFNVWGEQKRGKPTFFPTRICEGTQNRTYDYPAGRLNNATPPSGMTLNYGEKGVTECAFVQSPVTPGCDFFASRVELTAAGVGRIHPVGTLSAFEKSVFDKMLPELKASIAKGKEFALKWKAAA
jgi:hypothetical protein